MQRSLCHWRLCKTLAALFWLRSCRLRRAVTCWLERMAVGWATISQPACAAIRSVLLRLKSLGNLCCVSKRVRVRLALTAPARTFYDQDGNLSPALKEVLHFLSQFERSRVATNVTVSALVEAGVIRPWSIQIKGEDNTRVIGGLHRIDEAALRALSDDAFLKLRNLSSLSDRLRAIAIYGVDRRFNTTRAQRTQAKTCGVAR